MGCGAAVRGAACGVAARRQQGRPDKYLNTARRRGFLLRRLLVPGFPRFPHFLHFPPRRRVLPFRPFCFASRRPAFPAPAATGYAIPNPRRRATARESTPGELAGKAVPAPVSSSRFPPPRGANGAIRDRRAEKWCISKKDATFLPFLQSIRYKAS